MSTFSIRLKKYLPFLINIIFILLFYSFFLYDGGVWLSSDGLFPISDVYIDRLLSNSTSTWNNNFGLGYSAIGFNGTFRLPVYLLFYIIRKLGFSHNIVQYLYFVIVSVAGTFGWYFYAKIFTKTKSDKLLIFSSLFYVCNFYILARMHHYLIFQSMMFLPFFLVMVDRWLSKTSISIKDLLLTSISIYMVVVSAHTTIIALIITLITFIYKLRTRVLVLNFNKIKSFILLILLVLPIFVGTFYYFKNYSNHTQRFDSNYIYQDSSSTFKNFFLMGKNKSLVDNPQGQLIVATIFILVLIIIKKSRHGDRFYFYLYLASLIPSMSYFLLPGLYQLFSKIIPFLSVDYNYSLFFSTLYFPFVIYIFIKNYNLKIAVVTLVLYTLSLFFNLLINVNNSSYLVDDLNIYDGNIVMGRVMQYPLKFSYSMDRYPSVVPFSSTRYLYDACFITPSSKEITPDIAYNYAEEFEVALKNGDFKSFEYYAKLLRANYLFLYPSDYSGNVVNYLDKNYLKYFDSVYKIYWLGSKYDLIELNTDAKLDKYSADTIFINDIRGSLEAVSELKYYVSHSRDWVLIPLDWNYTDSIFDKLRVFYISIFENYRVYKSQVANYYNFWTSENYLNYKNPDSYGNALVLTYLPGLYYKFSVILSMSALFFTLLYKKLFNKK